jgi:hydroxymethylbilane synthase
MNEEKVIRLGTRGSNLALVQAGIVQEGIKKVNPGITVEIQVIKTSGDKITDQPLRNLGGKASFVKELEEALLQDHIDIAVHSTKDLEIPLPSGLIIGCFLEREDPRDVLISSHGKKVCELPTKAKIGTCSLRRAAQLLRLCPTLEIIPLRGNVDTRIRKLEEGQCEGIVLAYAGLKRLKKTSLITEIFEPEVIIPAIGQGIISVEIREKDRHLQEMLAPLNHKKTETAFSLESNFLKGFKGDCNTPIAAWAHPVKEDQERMLFHMMVSLPDGSKMVKETLEGDVETLSLEAYRLGQEFKRWYLKNTPSQF